MITLGDLCELEKSHYLLQSSIVYCSHPASIAQNLLADCDDLYAISFSVWDFTNGFEDFEVIGVDFSHPLNGC